MKHSDPTTAFKSTDPDSGIRVRIAAPEEQPWFDQQMADHHYLGAGRSVGDYLRQVVEVHGRPAALLLAWGRARYALKDRDRWIGWSAHHRVPAAMAWRAAGTRVFTPVSSEHFSLERPGRRRR